MNTTIAVLITCHNRREKTISCLHALYNCKLPENYTLDIFLVDDGSSDGTSEAVKTTFPEVNLIKGDGNLYWNRGMYLAWISAIKKKNFDFYLWLNDDTIIFKESLSLMLEFSLTINNKRIIIGATCSAVSGAGTYGGFIFPDKRVSPNDNWQDCDFFNGNIVLIPSYVFQQVGLLDKRFHHSLGDMDYGMRASKLGFVHCLAPNFQGTCEEHEIDPTWRNPNSPFFKRLKHLYSPSGNNPFESFIFERRHNGLYLSIVRFFSNHLRAVLPLLWKQGSSFKNDN